ncbi:hypothetical protein D3C72_1269420 [compost metagenome]
MGMLERRRVVHPIASYRDEMPRPCQRHHNRQLLLRTHSRIDPRMPRQVVERFLAELLGLANLAPRHDLFSTEAYPCLGGYRTGGDRVVTCHHRDLDAGVVAFSNRIRHLGSNRVLHACQPQEGQIDQMPVAVDLVRLGADGSLGECQHTQSLRGECLLLLQQHFPLNRRDAPPHIHVVAHCDQRLWCAFDENADPVFVPVERCRISQVGLIGNACDKRIPLPDLVNNGAALVRRSQKRDVHGVPGTGPALRLPGELRLVGQCRRPQQG